MAKKSFHFQGVLFYPLSILYGIIVWVRNVLFDSGILKSTEFQIPIISVGNITVGGTGKTPHTEYLIKLLKDEFKIPGFYWQIMIHQLKKLEMNPVK
jgi:tetraacyldisaccharide 4'-kinase